MTPRHVKDTAMEELVSAGKYAAFEQLCEGQSGTRPGFLAYRDRLKEMYTGDRRWWNINQHALCEAGTSVATLDACPSPQSRGSEANDFVAGVDPASKNITFIAVSLDIADATKDLTWKQVKPFNFPTTPFHWDSGTVEVRRYPNIWNDKVGTDPDAPSTVRSRGECFVRFIQEVRECRNEPYGRLLAG